MTRLRRILAALLVLLSGVGVPPATGAEIVTEHMMLSSPGGDITFEHYAVPGPDRRSSVIILHGRQGVEKLHDHYQRFAIALVNAGFDAYLVSYYAGEDAERANNTDAGVRRAYFSSRVGGWSQSVSAVVDRVLLSERASGRVALLGFSQGGFVATAVAGLDSRVNALAVFYGGIPGAVKDEIRRLPPLLEFHGDADRTVPLADGRALVDWSRAFGQPVEMVVYAGADHGFWGKDDEDSKRRLIAFLRRYL